MQFNSSPVNARLLIYYKGWRWLAYDKGEGEIVCYHQSDPYALVEWAYFKGYHDNDIYIL